MAPTVRCLPAALVAGALVAGWLSLAISTAACGKPDQAAAEDPAADEKDPQRRKPVARLGEKTIVTVGQLSDAINRQNPHIRMRYTSLERKKEYLKNMVRLEVLAAEATKRGLDSDPEVVRRVKRVMVDRLMEQLHKELIKFEDVTEADARAYYDENRERYQQPAKVRVSQVLVKTAAEARKVLRLAQQKPGNVRHFADLVAKHSVDEATRPRQGDLGFFAADDKQLPAAVVKAAFAIDKMWALAGPVETRGGYAVLLKTGDRPAVDRSFEAEKDRIRNRLFNQRRFEEVNRFVERLQKRAWVEVIDKNLAAVRIDSRAGEKPQPKGATPTKGPPGKLPRP